MHNVVERLIAIQSEIKELLIKNNSQNKDLNIIVVCKTFSIDKILPLIENGHVHFGENKVQEAELKWKEIKKKYSNIKLHMIGKLQTNKVKKALEIFDCIHTLDRESLAKEIVKNINQPLFLQKFFFIQVNTGEEKQKSGINLQESDSFIKYCKYDLKLNIIGLMCIPPINTDPTPHFIILRKLAFENKLKHLSMGMSNDYKIAIKNGSTFVRIGSMLFGARHGLK